MRRRLFAILAPATVAGALMFGVTLTGTGDHHTSAVADLPPAVSVEQAETPEAEQETTAPVVVEQETTETEQGETIPEETEQAEAPEPEGTEQATPPEETETAPEPETEGQPLMVSEDEVGTVSDELAWDAPAPCHWVGLTVEQCDEFANPAPGAVSVVIVYGTTFQQVEEVLIWENGGLRDIDFQHTDQRPEW